MVFKAVLSNTGEINEDILDEYMDGIQLLKTISVEYYVRIDHLNVSLSDNLVNIFDLC